MSEEILKRNLKNAQLEIDRKKDSVMKGKMRQQYHFMPQSGWLNDPNGLIFFKGKYHFFSKAIHMAAFGTVCTGDMQSAMIC